MASDSIMTSNFVPLMAPAGPPMGKPATVTLPHAHGHQPSLEVEREGEHVKRIKIRCGCGEVIVVDCIE